MKILLVHNYYGSEAPSGENRVFEIERELLKSRGHMTKVFVRHSDDIRGKGVLGVIRGGLSTPWNPWMFSRMKKVIASFKPDIVHVHNTFPLISPSIYYAIPKSIPCILTLHNYRIYCSAGIPMRNGKVCTMCIDERSTFAGVRYGCYRGGTISTLPLGITIWLQRLLGTWRDKVNGYIVLSEFQKSLMSRGGLPEDKIYVKPNYFPGAPKVKPWCERDNAVIFVGRISEEKGVSSLIHAWKRWGASAPILKIYGDGALRSSLQSLINNFGLNKKIFIYGQVAANVVEKEISNSKLLVLPSLCIEGFPMVIREAFAFGTPVAASNIGPLSSIVSNGKNGVVFSPGDPESIFGVIKDAWTDSAGLERLAISARQSYEDNYTEEKNYDSLIDIYRHVMAN